MKLTFSMAAQVFLHFRLSGITTFTRFLFLIVKQYRYKSGDKYINTHRQKEKQRVGNNLFPPVR